VSKERRRGGEESGCGAGKGKKKKGKERLTDSFVEIVGGHSEEV